MRLPRGFLGVCMLAVAAFALAGCRTPRGALALSPREVALHHVEQKQWAQALPLLEELHRQDPADLEVARELTQAFVRTERAAQFISRLGTSPEEQPAAVTHYMLGLARFAGPAQADQAIADFEEAARLSPKEPEFQYRLGLALLESEQYAKCTGPLQKAAALAPGRHEILLPLAKALHRQGDRAGAISALGQLIQAGPTPEEVQTARAIMDAIADPFVPVPRSARPKLEEGIAWLRERDIPQQAIVAFEEILRDYPDLGTVHALLGLAYQRIDDAGRAVEEFRRAQELSPLDGRVPLYLGLLYQSRQRGDQALPFFEQALTLDPLLDDAWLAVGDHYLGQRELEKANRAFRALSFLQPQSPAARGKYALVLQLQGDFAAADQQLHAIVDRDPDNVEFLLRLGMLHFERRKQARTEAERTDATREAGAWLRKVLEAQPENAIASRALEQLQAGR